MPEITAALLQVFSLDDCHPEQPPQNSEFPEASYVTPSSERAQHDGNANKRRRSDEKRHERDEDLDCSSNEDQASGCNDGPFWACPFYKLNPLVHYRCMEKYKFKRWGDVKQHVIRNHIKGPDRLTKVEDRALHEKPDSSDARLDAQEKWYQLWDKLFQGHKRPPSPHVMGGIAESLALFCSCTGTLLLDAVNSLLQASNGQDMMEASPHVQTEIQRIVSKALSSKRRIKRRSPVVATNADSSATELIGHAPLSNHCSYVPCGTMLVNPAELSQMTTQLHVGNEAQQDFFPQLSLLDNLMSGDQDLAPEPSGLTSPSGDGLPWNTFSQPCTCCDPYNYAFFR